MLWSDGTCRRSCVVRFRPGHRGGPRQGRRPGACLPTDLVSVCAVQASPHVPGGPLVPGGVSRARVLTGGGGEPLETAIGTWYGSREWLWERGFLPARVSANTLDRGAAWCGFRFFLWAGTRARCRGAWLRTAASLMFWWPGRDRLCEQRQGPVPALSRVHRGGSATVFPVGRCPCAIPRGPGARQPRSFGALCEYSYRS